MAILVSKDVTASVIIISQGSSGQTLVEKYNFFAAVKSFDANIAMCGNSNLFAPNTWIYVLGKSPRT